MSLCAPQAMTSASAADAGANWVRRATAAELPALREPLREAEEVSAFSRLTAQSALTHAHFTSSTATGAPQPTLVRPLASALRLRPLTPDTANGRF